MDSDTAGDVDEREFVELFDGGVGFTPLDGFIVVFYDGATDTTYAAFDLIGYRTNAAGYFTLGNNLVLERDIVFPNNFLQNGADAVALFTGNLTEFPNGTPITFTNLRDAVVYDTSDADDTGLLLLLNNGQPQVDENGTGSGSNFSIQRCPDGTGGLRNTFTYIPFTPTADRRNSCGQQNTQPGNNVTAGAAAGDANATFARVTLAGETTFTPISPSSAGTPPAGYTIVTNGVAYDVTTTATVVSPVTVCFTAGSVNDPTEFSRVRLLHLESGILVDRTIRAPNSPAPDFASRKVCASVTALSPFVTALAPPVMVSGRVVTPDGRGLRNAVVSLIDSQGVRRTATTSSFGIYSFSDVRADETYIFTIASKRYRFTPRQMLVSDSLSNVDFVGLE